MAEQAKEKSYRVHLMVCAGTACVSNNSFEIKEALDKEIQKQGLADEVLVMSRLPMKILAQFALSGPKPCRLKDPELIEIKEHVLRRLQEELGNEIP